MPRSRRRKGLKKVQAARQPREYPKRYYHPGANPQPRRIVGTKPNAEYRKAALDRLRGPTLELRGADEVRE